MKNRIFQVFFVTAFCTLLTLSSSRIDSMDVYAVTSEVRESTDSWPGHTNHYYYYGNGAIRSVNNKIGSTYNFTEDSFVNTVSSYADQLLGEVNYDDTREVWKKPGADNLSSLNSVMKMPTKEQRWYTNYSDARLKELNLIPNGTNQSEESAEMSNLVETGEVSTSELVSALSYLIEKDYYTLPQNVEIVKSSGSTPLNASKKKVQNANKWYYAKDSSGNLNNLKKSDLIMTLSKIFNGVQNSSAIVVKDRSERKGALWSYADITEEVFAGRNYSSSTNNKRGNEYYGKTYNVYLRDSTGAILEDGYDYFGVQFVGDYWVYYDPNVYELYLSQALRDGIITLTDLGSDSKFREDYKNKVTGDWNSGKIYTDDIISDKKNALGYSKSVAYNGHRLQIIQEMPDYFGEKEDMTMMEALRLIEAYMRANDENMSETEENIVRYKLGLTALSSMNSDDRSTVTYLIARGILDGNSSYLSGILYDDATISRIYPLLYRVANKNARSDFCTIQLTDSETFWASENFSQNTFRIFTPDNQIIHELVGVEKKKYRQDNKKHIIEDEDEFVLNDTDEERSVLANLKAAIVPENVHAAKNKTNANSPTSTSGINEYLVTMYFDKDTVYCIGNTTIGQLAGNPSECAKYSIESIDGNVELDDHNGKKVKVYKVTFKVPASTQEAAVLAVNNRIKALADLDKYAKAITGVTQIDSNGQMTNLVSQTSLKQAFSNISVLEDKILMNSLTGTLAYFSYDNKLAIVGSQIIKSDYSCITKTGNDIYYDLDAILPLLSATYVDTIGTQANIVKTDIDHVKTVKISTSRTDSSDYLLNAQYVKMLTHRTTKNDNDGDDSKGIACIYTKEAKKKADSDKNAQPETEYFLKLNTLSNVANNLTKSFSVDYNGTTITGTVIVDLQYAVPTEDNFSNWINTQIDSASTLTYNDAAKMLFTAPDKINEIPGYESKKLAYTNNKLLAAWYHSNYGMTNALCNWLYDTQAIVYVPSGYVCPSITLLMDNVGKKKFSSWCKSNEVRDAVFAKIFEKFELGGAYTKYNCGEQGKIWSNFFQCDEDSPDLKKIGFGKSTPSMTSFVGGSRFFNVYEEGSEKSRKDYEIGKLSAKQKLKVYGTRYVKSSSGCIYQRINTLGNPSKPTFTFTKQNTGTSSERIKELCLASRVVKMISPNLGAQVKLSNSTVRNCGSASASGVKYETICADKLFNGNDINGGCFKLVLKNGTGSNPYSLNCITGDGSIAITSDKFISMYAKTAKNIMGSGAPDDIEGPQWKKTFLDWLKEPSVGIFTDVSKIDVGKLKSILGSKECYLYTDVYSGKTDCSITPSGKIYQWDGTKLNKITQTKSLDWIATGKVPVYAIGRFYLPADQSCFTSSNGSTILSTGSLNKALNYMQYDMTSLNNQLIDAYLTEQYGVVSVDKLPKETKLVIGDTVWTKKGAWWQSAPITDLSSVASIKKNPKNLTSYMNKLFGGLFVTVQGKQYPMTGYVTSSELGAVVGTEKQLSKGLLHASGNMAQITKTSDTSGVAKALSATAATNAYYISIRCKFDKSMLARPIDSNGKEYIVVSHSGLAMITSAEFPFFDDAASWSKQNRNLYATSTSKFKPSPAYESAKKDFLSELRWLVFEDSWNLAFFLVLLLAAYLMVMTWFSYCVLSLGICKAGFQTLAMPNGAGGRNGIDLIKFATLGLYNIDKEITLGRMVMVSLGCCAIIVVTIVLIF